MAMNAVARHLVESMTDDLTLLDAGMAAVEAKMLEVCDSTVSVLRDASRHILSAGGKRVRPRLVMLAYIALGGRDVHSIAPVAAALELVHTASVVHDDINDHGVVRRGKPSVNAIWGRTFALLTGDFLFTKVYELMAPFKDLNVILADATVALVEGETLQAQAVKENLYTQQVYMDIIARKTASLFKAGGMLGAQAAGASRQIIEAMGNYGFNVGLAFQIIDDILDLTADEKQLGKTAGIDLEQGRGIAAFEINNSHDPVAAIKAKALSGNRINEGRLQAKMLSQLAIEELGVLPNSRERDELVELARYVVERDH
ncbi:MAG: polyprenyl synthetase family protein [Anaerolineae bacterium]|nr:polyprenyl synthetase family protein [Chloroflexota bacterium]MBP6298112.1 polyprenyl synthetase family protein [Anaerolineae bacterium]